MTHYIPSLTDWPEATAWIRSHIGSRNIIALTGSLGAGKTYFVQQFLKDYTDDCITSPSFSLIHEYHLHTGAFPTAYHLDLYRIENRSELETIGFYDLIEESAWIFIEWPQLILDQLPRDKTLIVSIDSEMSGRLLKLEEARVS